MGVLKILSEKSKLSEPSSGTIENIMHSELKLIAERKLVACTEVNHMIEIQHVTVRMEYRVIEVTSVARWRQGVW